MDTDITYTQMVCRYSNGHRLAHETARQCLEQGDLDLAAAWQMTARAWFQHRASAMDIASALLDTFSFGDASDAHERVNVARGTHGRVRLAVGDIE